MTDVLRKREHGWLRFNDGPDGYSFPDPTSERRTHAAWKARYALADLTQHDAYLLAEVFEAYYALMTHCWGTEVSIEKVRAIRRALRQPATDAAGEEGKR